jgi:type III secretion system FlhB-like substrate exporter
VVQRPGKKGKVPVPVIRITKTAAEGERNFFRSADDPVFKSAGDSAPAEQAGSVALPASRVESPEPSVGAGSGDSPASVSGKHGGGQQPPTTPKGPEDPTAAPTISEAQRKRMMAKAREAGVSTDDLKAIVADIAKVTSSKDIPADKYDTVISAVENWSEWQAQLVPERQEDVG